MTICRPPHWPHCPAPPGLASLARRVIRPWIRTPKCRAWRLLPVWGWRRYPLARPRSLDLWIITEGYRCPRIDRPRPTSLGRGISQAPGNTQIAVIRWEISACTYMRDISYNGQGSGGGVECPVCDKCRVKDQHLHPCLILSCRPA